MSWNETFAAANKAAAVAHIVKRRAENPYIPQAACDLIVAAIEAKAQDGVITVETAGHLGPDDWMNATFKVHVIRPVGA